MPWRHSPHTAWIWIWMAKRPGITSGMCSRHARNLFDPKIKRIFEIAWAGQTFSNPVGTSPCGENLNVWWCLGGQHSYIYNMPLIGNKSPMSPYLPLGLRVIEWNISRRTGIIRKWMAKTSLDLLEVSPSDKLKEQTKTYRLVSIWRMMSSILWSRP